MYLEIFIFSKYGGHLVSMLHKSAGRECGASAQNQATTHRQNCHNIAMFIFDKWKSKVKQNGYYSSFHFLLNSSHIFSIE